MSPEELREKVRAVTSRTACLDDDHIDAVIRVVLEAALKAIDRCYSYDDGDGDLDQGTQNAEDAVRALMPKEKAD